MIYATVSHGQAIYKCVYDSELGFMCGKCRGLLGFRPIPGDGCKCGARVEEAMYPSKKSHGGEDHELRDRGRSPMRQLPAPGGLRKVQRPD